MGTPLQQKSTHILNFEVNFSKNIYLIQDHKRNSTTASLPYTKKIMTRNNLKDDKELTKVLKICYMLFFIFSFLMNCMKYDFLLSSDGSETHLSAYTFYTILLF